MPAPWVFMRVRQDAWHAARCQRFRRFRSGSVVTGHYPYLAGPASGRTLRTHLFIPTERGTAMNVDLARFNMVEQHVRPCDILDQRVLDVLERIPRENFVPHAHRNLA